MVIESLKEASGYLTRKPVVWLTGLAMGLIFALEMILSISGDTFWSQQLVIFQVIVLPFFVAGTYGVIKEDDSGIGTFVRQGMKYYFPVLLPSLVIFFVMILTVFLIMIPLGMMGVGTAANLTGMMFFGVMIPVLFFTFFYDTAAVFEERKVFDSVRRSVEFVLLKPFDVLRFFLLVVVFSFVIWVVCAFAWTAIFAGQLEPLTAMTQAEIANLTPETLFGMIGEENAMLSALIPLFAVTLFVSLLYPFKAAFFRRYAPDAIIPETPDAIVPETPEIEVAETEGEYDEKGRWYKYS